MNPGIEFVDQGGLLKNPVFPQVAITKGNGNTIYIGGQNAITKLCRVPGTNDEFNVVRNLKTVS